MSKRLKAARFLVVAALLAGVLSCSSDDENALEPTSSPTAQTQPSAIPDTPTPTVDAATATPEATATAEPTATATATPDPTATVAPTPTAAPERDCPSVVPDDLQITHASLAATSIEISRALYQCAHEVGLAFADDPAAISTLMDRGIRGPLLLVDPWFDMPMMGELGRLAPELVVTAGFEPVALEYALVDFAYEQVPVDQDAAFSPNGLSNGRLWIVDAEQAVAAVALGQQIGARVMAVDGDLRALPPDRRQAILGAPQVELVGDISEDAAWQLEVVLEGQELPGGGLVLFDGDIRRRMVAIYGHPSGPGLGVLGEQSPEEGFERLVSIAEGYDADGSVVLPTFEIISTVASAGPGDDGDYSAETRLDVIRPWIETAAANGLYVVLDLQPGRTDYLTQAKIYEEFLRLPHVGLALDPEWRLKPDEVHLRQIGTVDAEEINQVVEWLAGIVREEALPQKLLILHQFRLQMITNRDLVETPSELAVLIHMDGQGPVRDKINTWNRLTGEPDADQFYWGWKNFYDEDDPMATPAQVLARTPNPVFVSFQ